MRKQIKGLVGITLVSAVAFGAAFSLQNVISTPVEEYEGIVLEGTVEAMSLDTIDGVEVRDIKKVVGKDGNISGYVVTVSEKGYGGEMLVDVAIDTNEMKLIGVHVGENNETEGLGTKVTEKEFLDQFKGMTLPIYMEGMGGSTESSASSVKTLKDGTYEAKSEVDAKGYFNQATMEVKNGKIASLVWECVTEDGTTKRQQVEAGEYIMTEDGPTWTEQADALQAAVVEGQSLNAIAMNEEGKTDAVAGVSINVMGFADVVGDCITQADASVKTELKDGTYEAKSEVDAKGYFNQATMEVKNGKVTSLVWECVTEDGTTKRQQVEAGEYIMTEDGPTWTEQADALQAAVVEGQSLNAIAMNEEGKTDAVAGVSINVMGFADVVEDCFTQAGAITTSKEAVPTEGTEIEAISGATLSSKAVARAIAKAYDCVMGMK